jgi:LmbE family N-acetylglucosaminyl deacetylase
MKWKYLIIPIIILSFLVLALFYSGLPLSSSPYPEGPLLGAGDRVLIVAPHPDDETITTAGIIKYCTDNKIPVKVVIMTDGDSYHSLAATRYNETQNATRILGLTPENVIFMGYPDGNLNSLFSVYWDEDKHFTNPDGHSIIKYSYAYKPNQTISGANLANNLEEVITNYHPTIIIGPDGEDQQIDHKATQAFLEYSAGQVNYTGKRYNYLVHLPPNWPNPRSYYPDYYLIPPPSLENESNWVVFPLNSTTENLKEAALKSYSSQVPIDSYLFSFIRKNELFNQYPPLKLTSNSPEIMINDTVAEDKSPLEKPSMDIKSISLHLKGENVYLYLKTQEPLKKEDSFNLHLIKSGGNRLDIKVYEGHAEVQFPTKSNMGSNLTLNMDNNEIILIIPTTILDGSEYLLLNAETSDGRRTVDQTRWNIINLK